MYLQLVLDCALPQRLTAPATGSLCQANLNNLGSLSCSCDESAPGRGDQVDETVRGSVAWSCDG